MNTYHFWCYIYDKRDEKLVYFLLQCYIYCSMKNMGNRNEWYTCN